MALHTKFGRWIIDYLDGTMPEEGRKLRERRIAKRPYLSKELNEYIKVRKLAGLNKPPEPDKSFWDGYLPRLRKRLESEPPRPLGWIPVPAVSAAALGLIILTTFITLQVSKSPAPDLLDIPRGQVVEELTISDPQLVSFISENYRPEFVVEEFFPLNNTEIAHLLTGGELNERF